MKREELKRRLRFTPIQQRYQYNSRDVIVCVIFLNFGCCFSSVYTLLPVERDNLRVHYNFSAFSIQMSMVDACFFTGCICGLLLSSVLQLWSSNFLLSNVCLFLSSIASVVMGLCKSLEFIMMCRLYLGLLVLSALDALMNVSILSPCDHLRLITSASVAFGYALGNHL